MCRVSLPPSRPALQGEKLRQPCGKCDKSKRTSQFGCLVENSPRRPCGNCFFSRLCREIGLDIVSDAPAVINHLDPAAQAKQQALPRVPM